MIYKILLCATFLSTACSHAVEESEDSASPTEVFTTENESAGIAGAGFGIVTSASASMDSISQSTAEDIEYLKSEFCPTTERLPENSYINLRGRLLKEHSFSHDLCEKLDKAHHFGIEVELFIIEKTFNETNMADFQKLLNHCGALVSLRLFNNDIGEAGALMLAECSNLKNLHTLWINNGKIGNDGIAALANSPHMANLRELSLCGNKLSFPGVRSLAESRFIRQLIELDLGKNLLQSNAIICLIDSGVVNHVTSLYFGYNQIGDDALIHLASWPQLNNVTDLNFEKNNIGDKGAIALCKSPYADNIQYLDFFANEDITEPGEAAIEKKFPFYSFDAELESDFDDEYCKDSDSSSEVSSS
jgi:hypothetical protein